MLASAPTAALAVWWLGRWHEAPAWLSLPDLEAWLVWTLVGAMGLSGAVVQTIWARMKLVSIAFGIAVGAFSILAAARPLPDSPCGPTAVWPWLAAPGSLAALAGCALGRLPKRT